MEFASKIVLCGDGAVGKTTLRRKFMGLQFKSQYLVTMGAELSIMEVYTIIENKKYLIKFHIWDLAGQPVFDVIRKEYYEGAHAALLMYDITNKKSFENIYNWFKEIKTNTSSFPYPMIIIGNKIDLKNQVNQFVSPSDGKNLAKEISKSYAGKDWKIPYRETSALTGENINLVFEELGKMIIKTYLGDFSVSI